MVLRLKKSGFHFVSCLFALVLMISLFSGFAYADEGSVADNLAEKQVQAVNRFLATGVDDYLRDFDTYRSAEGDKSADVSTLGILPARYDLREKGVVTSVKNQSPWGTCWGFAAIAAVETSIMSELGMTAGEGELDLSELHTAWFAYTPLPENSGAQAGEGVHTLETDAAGVLNQGGLAFITTSIFSSGIGPVPEATAPYRNKEGQVYADAENNPLYFTPGGTWALEENLRFAQSFELEHGYVLPTPAYRDELGNYHYNEEGTRAIKEELMEGRAVDIAFASDNSMPGQQDPPKYINTDTWAHYTYEDTNPSHAVAIVGWDDDYAATNFIAGHQPPHDGAWIVKNSWGSKAVSFPHYDKDGWGVDGEGYFYLSYYDKSLDDPETFDFNTENYGEEAGYYLINQHDYMPIFETTSDRKSSLMSMANVFEADERQRVRSLSCETASPHTTAEYRLYLLRDGYSNPEDGELLTTVSETYKYGGYHRVELGEGFVVEKGQHYSVVVTLKCNAQYEMLAGASANKAGMAYINEQNPGANYSSYAVGVINRGESFLYTEGAWNDWVDVVVAIKEKVTQSAEGNLYDYDNFALKAYADPAVAEIVIVPDVFNMTEAEALAALQQAKLQGQAGAAEYSDVVEAGRVVRQDIAAGTSLNEGSFVTYFLSLGKAPAVKDDPANTTQKSPKAGTLAPTGDNASPLVVTLCGAMIACITVAVAKRRREK